MEKFHVNIHQQPWNDGLSITIWEERQGKVFVAKRVDLVFEECQGGYTTDPTLQLSHFHAPVFLNALAEALDKHGVKTDKDAKLQGTLEATKYHLQDLRKLLKLEPKQCD
jgi:hypothetical protein